MRILDLYAICKTMLRTSFDENVKDKEHVLITRRLPPDNIQGSCPFTSFFGMHAYLLGTSSAHALK